MLKMLEMLELLKMNEKYLKTSYIKRKRKGDMVAVPFEKFFS